MVFSNGAITTTYMVRNGKSIYPRGGAGNDNRKQKDYILDLYKEIDIEPKEDLDELTKQQASELIQELTEIKEDMN